MIISSSARTPGTMKWRLRSCGLNHTRIRASIDPIGGAPAGRAASASSAAFSAMSVVAYVSPTVAELESDPSATTCTVTGAPLATDSPYSGGIDSAIQARRLSMSRWMSASLDVTCTTLK